jgi:hypothetical protein
MLLLQQEITSTLRKSHKWCVIRYRYALLCPLARADVRVRGSARSLSRDSQPRRGYCPWAVDRAGLSLLRMHASYLGMCGPHIQLVQARALATRRGARFLSAEDLIFLVRHDREKVNRLRTYLSWKEVRKHAKDSGGDAGGAVEVEALEDGADGM